MSDGNDRTDPDDPPEGDAQGEGILDPDDLDIRERDEVHERGEGRYVISTGGGAAADEGRTTDEPTASGGARADPSAPTDAPDDRPHLDALAAELGALSAPYGLALAGKAEGEAASIQVAATDPADVLGAVVRWYAERVDPDGVPDETAAALLAAAGFGEFDGGEGDGDSTDDVGGDAGDDAGGDAGGDADGGDGR